MASSGEVKVGIAQSKTTVGEAPPILNMAIEKIQAGLDQLRSATEGAGHASAEAPLKVGMDLINQIKDTIQHLHAFDDAADTYSNRF